MTTRKLLNPAFVNSAHEMLPSSFSSQKAILARPIADRGRQERARLTGEEQSTGEGRRLYANDNIQYSGFGF